MNKKSLYKYLLADAYENAIFNSESYEILEELLRKPDSDETLKKAFNVITTLRNRDVIQKDGQAKLNTTVVAFLGLSVGSHAALTWMMESKASIIKISDPDYVSPTNLNRLRFSYTTLGEDKIEVVKDELESINPFCKIISNKNNSIKSTIELIEKTPVTNLIVDAMDDLASKIEIRKYAKENNIPVIMATDIGDNIMLDIERYDLRPQPELFLGKAKNIENIDINKISDKERRGLTISIVGFENNSEAMLESLLSIGKTLKTWPQLGATATIAGGVITTSIKKIVLGEKVLSGRYFISLDSLLLSDWDTKVRENKRRELIQKIRVKFNL